MNLKLTIALLFGLMLITLLIINSSFIVNKFKAEPDLNIVNFEFIQETKYNEAAVKKIWSIDENVSLTWLEIAPNQEVLDLFSKEGEFIYDRTFNFEEYCMLISYGRKIVGLECEKSSYFGGKWVILIATFDEVHYKEKVFFYKMDDKKYVPSDLGIKCYIMNGSRRLYVGDDLLLLNKI